MDPRLLLLEDDPVSAAFLQQVLQRLPARVDVAGSLAEARRVCHAGHALWLFDARLPDGESADLLAEWRRQGRDTPALALTADDDPVVLARLSAAGFDRVMSKPIDAATLLAALRQHLHQGPAAPAWDDPAALRALGGSHEAMAALRKLFLDELPAQARALGAALDGEDLARARDLLHRLTASCGFVGALGLLTAVKRLQSDLSDRQARRLFEASAEALLAG